MEGDPGRGQEYILWPCFELSIARADPVSDKRPETDADILSRSRVLSSEQLRREERRRKGGGYRVDLPSHMAQCDANYHLLLQLFPGLRDEQSKAFSLALGATDIAVSFTVLEKGPYTTQLEIGPGEGQGSLPKWLEPIGVPQMRVQVYHDARSAEVMSYQHENRFHGAYEYPNHRMRQRDEKAQLNRFLGEFLALCMDHGASRQPVELR